MRGAHKIQVTLLLLVFAWGCMPRSRVPLSPEEILFQAALLHQIQERSHKIHSLSGAARITVRRPEGPYAAEEIIRLRFPDDLRLETRDPMGRLQILLIANGNDGAVLFPGTSSTETRFSAKRSSVKRYLGLDLSVPELLGLFTGTPPLRSWEPDRMRVLREEEVTRLQIFRQGRLSHEVWLDRMGQVFRWNQLDGEGRSRNTIVFNDFREVNGISIPFEISFQGSDRTTFVLRYRSLFLNQAIDDPLFDVSRIGEVLEP